MRVFIYFNSRYCINIFTIKLIKYKKAYNIVNVVRLKLSLLKSFNLSHYEKKTKKEEYKKISNDYKMKKIYIWCIDIIDSTL